MAEITLNRHKPNLFFLPLQNSYSWILQWISVRESYKDDSLCSWFDQFILNCWLPGMEWVPCSLEWRKPFVPFQRLSCHSCGLAAACVIGSWITRYCQIIIIYRRWRNIGIQIKCRRTNQKSVINPSCSAIMLACKTASCFFSLYTPTGEIFLTLRVK